MEAYEELKQVKEILEKYKIEDMKQLDEQISYYAKEYEKKINIETMELQARIDNIKLIKIPGGVSEEVAALISEANDKKDAEKSIIRIELIEKQTLLTKLK